MTEGVIFDLGYQPHEGKRLGRSGAVRALYRDGLRRVLGLRRRARSKILPALLLSIALLPAILFVGIGVLFAGADFETDSFFSHAEYFEYSGWIALILSALAAGELLVALEDTAYAVVKYILQCLGICSARTVSPHRDISPQQAKKLDAVIEDFADVLEGTVSPAPPLHLAARVMRTELGSLHPKGGL